MNRHTLLGRFRHYEVKHVDKVARVCATSKQSAVIIAWEMLGGEEQPPRQVWESIPEEWTVERVAAPVANSRELTYREIKQAYPDLEIVAPLSHDLRIKAFCAIDDEEELDDPAVFDVFCSWGDGIIGRFDRDNELDTALNSICELIAAKVGGKWTISSDNQIIQVVKNDL